jgi:hypothetical protein
MADRTRILVVEDMEADFELAWREVRKLIPASDFQRVETAEAFVEALAAFQPDLIISDYSLPLFDGLTALKLAQQRRPDTPVIIYTCAINEDTAVECMKAGAADYVIKEHLKRLGPAVVRSLEEKQERLRRRQAEAALTESNERLRQLAENIDSLLFVLDLDGPELRLCYLSPACERIWGRNPEQFYRDPLCWLENVHEEDRAAVEEAVRQIRTKDTAEIELQYRARRPEGIRWIRIRAKAVQAGTTEQVRVVGLAEDITARRVAEEANARLQAQLAQAQKMETVGRLAGGVAHDFNNLIGVILGYTELLQERLAGRREGLRELAQIERASRRARDLTSQLLAFSRKQMISPQVLNLNHHIAGVLQTLARLIREDIDLRFEPGGALWNIAFDPSQLDQVLVNLAVNARDAMPGGGTLAIATGNLPQAEAHLMSVPDMAPGDYVLLSVRDSGVGMNPEVSSHIFEPFFTTKGLGQGTGLGLSTVYGIVAQNGSYIDVSSAPGQGSTFRIAIPRSLEAVRPAESEQAGFASRGSGYILLVEDDEQVRQMVAEMLQFLGYTVTVAATPEEALALNARAEANYDLLVSDVVMPQVSGPELAQRLRLVRPQMRVLYISGYASDSVLGPSLPADGPARIQKPFDIRALAQAVKDVLR